MICLRSRVSLTGPVIPHLKGWPLGERNILMRKFPTKSYFIWKSLFFVGSYVMYIYNSTCQRWTEYLHHVNILCNKMIWTFWRSRVNWFSQNSSFWWLEVHVNPPRHQFMLYQTISKAGSTFQTCMILVLSRASPPSPTFVRGLQLQRLARQIGEFAIFFQFGPVPW